MKIQTDERIEEICQITNQEIKSKTASFQLQFDEQERNYMEKYEQNIKTKHLIQSSEISSEQKKKILQAEWQYLDLIKKSVIEGILNMNHELMKEFLTKCLLNVLRECQFSAGRILCLKSNLDVVKAICSENQCMQEKFSKFVLREDEFASDDMYFLLFTNLI